MALATKYTFSFASVLDGELHTIVMKQEGYGGSPIALPYMVGRNFMVLSYDKGNANLLHPIRGSQLTLRVSLEPSQIQEFVLADNRTWYIEWTGANGWEWYGWLQPQTSINYTPYGLRELELQFSDNLGALQTAPDTILQNSFVYLQTIQEMIERQLSYTDVNLPVTISTSVRHANSVYDYIYNGTYLEAVMCNDFLGEEPQMAYDLLSKFLRLLQCSVYQKAGNWVVENFIDKTLAGYPNDVLDLFEVADRGINIRFESPLSKVVARSYHYQIRHSISNRDFAIYVPSGPNKGFLDWEQDPPPGDEIFSLFQSGGINFFGVLGNYVAGNAASHGLYQSTSFAQISEGDPLKLYLNYNNTFSGLGTVNPRIALRFEVGVDIYYLNTLNEWQLTGTPIILKGDAEILNAKSITTLAPGDGVANIEIYRPEVPALGTTYNSSTSYIRYSYADFGVGKVVNETDYKVFKSVGTKANAGLRPNEEFETIGLAYDREFYPQANSLLFSNYISLFYDEAGDRLAGNFISDYMPTSQPWGPTEFAANTYMRLFAKPQLYAEIELYGKALNVGDIYTLNVPGLPADLPFVVVAYDWDVQSDRYSALMAYISYDPTDTITMQRYWLQQNQDDPDGK